MKNSSIGMKILTAALCLVVMGYFAIQGYRYFTDPLTTSPAYTYRVEQSVTGPGWVVREERVLTAPETRSSSPVRILRDESRQSQLRGLYPTGEGAGYAGGIMSAAVDGIQTAEAILAELQA